MAPLYLKLLENVFVCETKKCLVKKLQSDEPATSTSFLFSTSMWEILREQITPSQVADQNTAGFALILFARGLHHMKITKKKTGNWSNVIKSEVT